MKNDTLPTELQRQKLCELMAHAFVSLRYLDGAEANDLAYAFHNIPMEMYGVGGWSVKGTRSQLLHYQKKHPAVRPDFVALFDEIFPPN